MFDDGGGAARGPTRSSGSGGGKSEGSSASSICSTTRPCSFFLLRRRRGSQWISKPTVMGLILCVFSALGVLRFILQSFDVASSPTALEVATLRDQLVQLRNELRQREQQHGEQIDELVQQLRSQDGSTAQGYSSNEPPPDSLAMPKQPTRPITQSPPPTAFPWHSRDLSRELRRLGLTDTGELSLRGHHTAAAGAETRSSSVHGIDANNSERSPPPNHPASSPQNAPTLPVQVNPHVCPTSTQTLIAGVMSAITESPAHPLVWLEASTLEWWLARPTASGMSGQRGGLFLDAYLGMWAHHATHVESALRSLDFLHEVSIEPTSNNIVAYGTDKFARCRSVRRWP